jgi:ferritin-like metal-binding protein YciE
MANEQNQLDALFHHTLKGIYFAEKKILATLPKMEKAARSPELKKAFEKHRGETEIQVNRLEKVLRSLSLTVRLKRPNATLTWGPTGVRALVVTFSRYCGH